MSMGADQPGDKRAEQQPVEQSERQLVTLTRVGARESVDGSLVGRFIGVGAADSKSEFQLAFRPRHSETEEANNHARTIVTLIRGSVSWDPRDAETPARFHPIEGRWFSPRFEMVFSIPKYPRGKVSVTTFEGWRLHSIKLRDTPMAQTNRVDK
jgi:hypothetical protein